MEAGDYTLSGCEGGSNSTYSMETYDGTSYRACQNGKTTFNTAKTSIRFYISVKSGVTVNNVTFYPMIVKGTEEKEYEPYGSMPSPEYQSPIQNVEGDVNVNVCNKNLYELDGKSRLRNGVDYIIENNSIIAERKTVSSSGSYYNDMTRKKLLAGTYTISGVDSSFIYEKARVEIFVADSENKDESKATRIEVISNDRPSIQYSSDKDFYISFSVVVTGKSDVGEIFVFKPQVEVGSTATNFVENKKQTITFPLLEGQKLYLNDYFADDGIHHVRKQIELDGSENWVLYTGYANNTEKGYCYYLSIPDCKIVRDTSISSHFKNVFGSYQTETGYIGAFSDHLIVKNKYFISDKATLEEFKTYLSQQKQAGTPVIVEYELAEEEIEPYTPEQQEAYNQLYNLTAYEEETNVYSTNEVSPVFTVTAVKDICYSSKRYK